MAAEWTWMLCDGQGAALAELTTAAGKRVAYRRNSYAEASCTISCDDPAALLVTEALKTGWPRLRCYRRADGASSATLRFNGHFAPIVQQAEVASTMQIVARSPFARMFDRYLIGGQAPAPHTAEDAGSIVSTLLLQGGASSIGLATGTIEATKLRDITYQAGQCVGEAIVNLSAMLDGFDFAERYVDETSVMAYLDIVARQGVVQANARFEYGDSTMANLRAVSQTIAPPVNHVALLGADGLQTFWPSSASEATYGRWAKRGSYPSISVLATLDERAKSMLRPAPVQTVQMVPETNAPSPWDDFYLGDTASIYARRGSLQIDTAARVNAFTVLVDDNGIESAEIPDPQTPDEEAALRASLEVEVIAA